MESYLHEIKNALFNFVYDITFIVACIQETNIILIKSYLHENSILHFIFVISSINVVLFTRVFLKHKQRAE